MESFSPRFQFAGVPVRNRLLANNGHPTQLAWAKVSFMGSDKQALERAGWGKAFWTEGYRD